MGSPITPTPPVVTRLGTVKAASTPRVYNGVVWFQGEDNMLWTMPIAHPERAASPIGVGCQSTPLPATNGYVYLQSSELLPNGLNPGVQLEQRAPWLHMEPNTCQGAPIRTPDGTFFFLIKSATAEVRLYVWAGIRGSFISGTAVQLPITDVASLTIGAVGKETYAVFSNSALTKVYSKKLTGQAADATSIDMDLNDGPVFRRDGKLFVTRKDSGRYVELNPTTLAVNQETGLYSCATTPVEPLFTDDGNLYYIGTNNEVWMTKQSDLTQRTKLGHTAPEAATPRNPNLRPDPQGDGGVVFLDQDRYICAVGLTVAPQPEEDWRGSGDDKPDGFVPTAPGWVDPNKKPPTAA